MAQVLPTILDLHIVKGLELNFLKYNLWNSSNFQQYFMKGLRL
jgi:hypothetical protein